MVMSLPIGNDYNNISPGPQYLYGLWTPQCSLAGQADESLPSNIAGGFLRFLHFIYFATSVNKFIFLFLERSLRILFILAGERFAEECEKGKRKNIAAYWTLL